jgi:hypothetical protein
MKSLILLSILTLCLLSCDDSAVDTNALPANKQLDFGDFTIEVPATWQPVTLQGIDSYIGGIQMDQDQQATFDLGWYSNSLDVDTNTHAIDMIRIDDKEAKRVTPMTPGRGITGVFIPNLNDGGLIRFELHGEDLTAENQQALMHAVETIDFK